MIYLCAFAMCTAAARPEQRHPAQERGQALPCDLQSGGAVSWPCPCPHAARGPGAAACFNGLCSGLLGSPANSIFCSFIARFLHSRSAWNWYQMLQTYRAAGKDTTAMAGG